MKEHYLVMMMTSWEYICGAMPGGTVSFGLNREFGDAFVRVYESREEAERLHPGRTIAVVRQKACEEVKA